MACRVIPYRLTSLIPSRPSAKHRFRVRSGDRFRSRRSLNKKWRFFYVQIYHPRPDLCRHSGGGIRRLSEALTVLPFFFPAATPGLVVGCFIANLFSPYSLDVVFGTAATLLACLITQRMPNKWLAPLPPVLCNAVIVGAECAWYQVGFTAAFWPAYAFNAFTVGVGELLACYILGSLLIRVLPRVPCLRTWIPERRLEQLGV